MPPAFELLLDRLRETRNFKKTCRSGKPHDTPCRSVLIFLPKSLLLFPTDCRLPQWHSHFTLRLVAEAAEAFGTRSFSCNCRNAWRVPLQTDCHWPSACESESFSPEAASKNQPLLITGTWNSPH